MGRVLVCLLGSTLHRIRLIPSFRTPEACQSPIRLSLSRFFGESAALDELDELTVKLELDSSSSCLMRVESAEETAKGSACSKNENITSMVDLLVQHNKGQIESLKREANKIEDKASTTTSTSNTGDSVKLAKQGAAKSEALLKTDSFRLEKLLGSLTVGGKRSEGEGERKRINIDAILSGIRKVRDLKQAKNPPNHIESIVDGTPQSEPLTKESEDEFSDLDNPPEIDTLAVQRFAKTQEQNAFPQSLMPGGHGQNTSKASPGMRGPSRYDNRPNDARSDFTKEKIDSVVRSSVMSAEFRKERLTPACRDDLALTVAVENIPEYFSISRFKEALSHHGEITGFLKMPAKNGSTVCHIEFQTQEGREKALADRWVSVDGQRFRLQRLGQPKTTVVRIMNVSPATCDEKVLLTCNKCGQVDDIRKRDKGIYDVYFSLKEQHNMHNILDGLNEVSLHQNSWRAHPAPLLHSNAKEALLNTQEDRMQHRSRMNQSLQAMEKGVQSLLIGIQDLQHLFLLEEKASACMPRNEEGALQKPEDACLDKLLRSSSK